RKAYDAGTTPEGANTTVAIISGGTDLSQVILDLRQAEKDFNLPFVPVSIEQVDPVPNPQTPGNDDEWDLDSQSSSGIAGNVKQIIFYNGTALDDAITLGANKFATDNTAKALNISIGGCESVNFALGTVATDDQAFMQAASQGQTVFVSAGDAGAACGVVINLATPQGGVPQQVEYPASSPYVVAVGGTSLFTDADFNYATETAWNAGGGGNSLFETAPSWQAGAGVLGAIATLRGVPDVSMNAGFNLSPAAAFYSAADTVVAGRHEAVIGTSLSSPLSMGVWARLQSAHCNQFGFAAPMFYALDTAGGPGSTAKGFTDILVGTNGGYVATPGWDYTTGFGSFDISAVNQALPAVTCPANTAPVAKLASSAPSGAAPLAVSFDASQSSDADGDQLAYYIMDYGDGSPVDFKNAPSFTHVYANAGAYTASLSVRDARGAASAPVSQTIVASGTPLACTPPGVLLLTSPKGSASLEGQDPQMGNGSDDLLATYLAEPGNLSNKLVFTMQVVSLSTVPAGYRWVTYFSAKGADYYVSMGTANGPSPVFTYGSHQLLPGAGASTFQQLGTLDAASNFNANGTITLILDKAALGLKTGDILSNISTSVRTSAPDDPTGTVAAGSGLTVDGAGDPSNYRLVGNDTCASGGGSSSSSSSGGSSSSGSSSSGGSSSSSSSSGGSSSSSSSSSGGSSSSGSSSGGSSSGGGTVPESAILHATPNSGTAPLAVNFDASGSKGTNGSAISNYSFNFGDGSAVVNQSGATVSHTYSNTGSYSASVTVTDASGAQASTSAVITVQTAAQAPDTPGASLSASPSSGSIGVTVNFDASGSHDTDGDAITQYVFDFGDGSPKLTTAAATAGHTYTAAGSFTAAVTVTDSKGHNSAAATVPVTVTASVSVTPSQNPVAAFTLSPTSGPAPLTVNFDGSQSFDPDGDKIASYTFDFGDGSAPVTQSTPKISHIYTAPGNYQPALTAADSGGTASTPAKGPVLANGPAATAPSGGPTAAAGGSGGGAMGSGSLLALLLGVLLMETRRRVNGGKEVRQDV
ncbi:MAG: PKD domain-containing protein, partial [Stenotrophobium sp.]